MIASDRFVLLEGVGDSLCEVVNHKRALSMKVPVVVGFSLIQLAKLRMLEFYNDCIDRFVDRKDLQYVEMDTDSAYMAQSAPLQNIIKPGMENEFWKEYGRWFPRHACEFHNSEFLECMLSGSRVTAVNESQNRTRGRLGCSRRNTKVQWLLLLTQRPMSVGTLSRTHQRQAFRELASA